MNVPETMNEVLDMSDDEGIWKLKKQKQKPVTFQSVVFGRSTCLKTNKNCMSWIWYLHIHCFILFLTHWWSMLLFNFVYLNHAVRKANAPEILSDAEYLSDVEEGICAFLYCSVT